MKILIVDDNSAILSSLELLLEVDGHSVSAVSSGNEALSLLTPGHQFDLVVTDLKMPGMDGDRLFQQAIEQLDGSLPPFVLHSTFVEGVRHTPVQLPWTGMIPKGQPDELRDFIQKLPLQNAAALGDSR
ncbi:MAG: response regulator [Planctomycetota bacterium]|jgi:CheY-like chemotaxis protein